MATKKGPVEVYKSKAAKVKHEKTEPKKKEAKETKAKTREWIAKKK
jgi:hypothetical protein